MKLYRAGLIILLSVIAILSFIYGGKSCSPTGKNISLNIFSSTVVVLVLELVSFLRDIAIYSFLNGKYKRTGIFREVDEGKGRIGDSKYISMPEYNTIDPNIKLNYNGDGMYTGNVIYLKGEAQLILNLNMSNRMIGTGSFQYLEANPDVGSYIFQVDRNKKIIYIFYSNLLPSGLAKGYEVWKRV